MGNPRSKKKQSNLILFFFPVLGTFCQKIDEKILFNVDDLSRQKKTTTTETIKQQTQKKQPKMLLPPLPIHRYDLNQNGQKYLAAADKSSLKYSKHGNVCTHAKRSAGLRQAHGPNKTAPCAPSISMVFRRNKQKSGR